MATIQDVFSHIYTTEAHLGDVPVKNGQIILCTDSEKLYIDHETTRVSTSDVIQVDNQEALPLAPLDKLYITKDTGDIFFYINGAWEKINQSDISVGAGLSGNGSSSSPLQLDIKNYSSTDNINLTSSNQVNITGTNSISLLSNDNQSSIEISATGIVLNSYVGVTINSQGNALSFATGTNSSGERDIYLDNHSMNTAGGFAVVDLTTGKLPIGIIPDVTGDINIDNYTSNSTIRLTSTAGAVNLISNTGEVGLYSGSNVYVKVLTDTVELKATTVSLNGHAQNTAGGFAIVDIETGKLPASIIPEQTNIDLSDAVLRYPATVDTESKVVTITDGTPVKDVRIGDEIVTAAGVYKKTKDSITTSGDPATSSINISGFTNPSNANGTYVFQSDKKWKHESENYWVTTSSNHWVISYTEAPAAPSAGLCYAPMNEGEMPWDVTNWQLVSSYGTPVLEQKTADTVVDNTIDLFEYASLPIDPANIVQSVNGKKPDASGNVTIDLPDGGLTSVSVGNGLTGNGTSGNPISLDLSNYGTGNAISLTSAGGFTFKIGTVAVMTLNTDANAHFATHTYLAENPEANVYFHGNATNTANGLVVLGADGKVPSSLLPEMSQSWTKVTINQSSFATSDDTYGGSYYELNGICSVEVYDADGYKVEFDVKCDFTGNKTRIYIPSGLTADTISNWTLLYLAKTIA